MNALSNTSPTHPLTLTGLALATLCASSFASRSRPQATPADQPILRSDDAGHSALAWLDATRASIEGGAPAPVQADWTALGPFGGDMADVAASPTASGVVLAAYAPVSGGGGIYRSSDSGATWTVVAGMLGLPTYDLEFASDGTAYAGTLDGVWKSADDGQNWTTNTLGIGLNDQVFEVTLDPNNNARVWAGIADALGNQPVNLMLSTDAGLTWADRTPPLAAPMACRGLTLDPNNSSKVYAVFGGGFGGGAVWVSSNGGTSWVNRSAGLPANPMNDAQHDGSRLLVCGGMAFGSQFVGLYQSTDEGVSWQPLHSGGWPSLVINDIEIDPANAANLWVASGGQGAFHSTDGGLSWTFGAGGTGPLSMNEVSFEPGNTSTIYTAASSNAIWKSTDGGASFAPSSFGIGALNVYSVATNPLASNEYAVAFQGLNDGGVYTSTDAGLTWSLEALPGTRYNTVGFAPNGNLHALSDGPSTIAPEGLYRRVLGSWSSLGPDQGTLFESELVALRFSENDPQLILLGGGDFGVAGFEPTVWRSADDGASWTKVWEGPDEQEDVQDIEIVEDGSDLVMLASYTDFGSVQDGGVLRSSDGGLSWNTSNSGLPALLQGESLCPSPAGPTTFYLADNEFPMSAGGLYVTTDAGLSWTSSGWSERLYRVECDPNDANVLYAARFDSPKLLRSIDAGVSFSAFDDGAAAIGTARDLFIPASGSALFLGSSTGAWRTILIDGIGTNYCTANANSTGFPAEIGASGSASVAANSLTLSAQQCPPTQNGIFYYGSTSIQLVFGNGFRCVGAGATGVGRLPVVQADGGGVASYQVDFTSPPTAATAIVAGSTWYFQFWYRDPAGGGAFFDLTDGVQIDFTL